MSARFCTGRACLARPGFAVQLFSSPNGGWVRNFNRFSWIWPKGPAGWVNLDAAGDRVDIDCPRLDNPAQRVFQELNDGEGLLQHRIRAARP